MSRTHRPTRTAVGMLLAGALGTWAGIHLFRMFLAAVVWPFEDAPLSTMGAVAGAVYAVGLLAWLATRLVGGRRPVWRFGLALAAILVLRQALPVPYLSQGLAYAGIIVWLWWVPAYLEALARAGLQDHAAPAVLLGLAGQVALQGALHGMDLPMLQGPLPVFGAALMAGGLVAGLLLAGRGDALPDRLRPLPAIGGWGGAALGPFLFLQMTLLTNAGRLQVMSGWDLPVATGLIEAGLLAGLAVLKWAPPRWAVLAIGTAAVLVLLPGARFHGEAALVLIPLQALLAMLLASAFAPGPVSSPGQPFLAPALGAVLLFGLDFQFYAKYGMFSLWPVAAGMLTLLALLPARGQSLRLPLAWAAAAAVAAAGVGLATLPRSGADAAGAGPAPHDVTVLQYNIHNGFNNWDVPSAQRISETIESANADFVTLEEVNRGWDMSGGADMVAWLRWRLPQYHLIYGSMNGDLFGNAILTKYPVLEMGAVHFPLRHQTFPRGLVWARVESRGGDLLVVGTHLAAWSGYDDDRTAQAGDLLNFWAKQPRTIIAGDFNAHPQDAAIQRLEAAGLKDVPGISGLGQTFTYPAQGSNERLDYIFSSPDLTTSGAKLIRTTASDHLPVLALVHIR